MSAETTTFEFKTETRQLLDLMIHSVYSHKEIFLRELISNASDALDKLRFAALTRDDLRGLTEDLHIRIEADREKHTLCISDNGIGMSRDEVVEFIGTIARSGTRDYAKLLQEAKDKEFNAELIGQFGVGFYSSFMVADRVELVTRRAGEAEAWHWESKGDGQYTLGPAERATNGTSVTLHLKKFDKDDETDDFAAEWTIRDLVRKYSDFVSYPIKMKVERTETVREGDAKPEGERKVVVEDQTLNSMKAIWTRPEKDVTDEEYQEFYKHLSHDWTDPCQRIVYRAEGATTEFKALLYLPSHAGQDLFFGDRQRGISLYIKRVFIMHDCKDLIPEYLRFVRGVVDSEDLPLNISREILQHDKRIVNIKKALTHKVLATLKTMRTDQNDKYLAFWKEFGRVVKEGLFKEPGDRERLFDVALFASTASPTALTTIDDYIGRMKSDQDKIYYLTGETREALERSPHLEAFRDKGIEVLLLSDPIDEIWVQFVFDVKGKKMQAASKGAVELGSKEEREKAEAARKESETQYKTLLETIKEKLTDHVKEVRLSTRLTTSPACLVSDAADMSPQLEALMKASGKEVPKTKRILEINPEHDLLKKLQTIHAENRDDHRISEYAQLLYGQSVLAEGGRLPENADFVKILTRLMTRSL